MTTASAVMVARIVNVLAPMNNLEKLYELIDDIEIAMMTTRYSPIVAMDPNARAPDPGALADYAGSYTSADYLARTGEETLDTAFGAGDAGLRRDRACRRRVITRGHQYPDAGGP